MLQGWEITLSYVEVVRIQSARDNYLKAVLHKPCDCVMQGSERAGGEKLSGRGRC